MSQFDLTQLSKKNQEFVRIAKHQLIENGKTEEEATSLIEEILPDNVISITIEKDLTQGFDYRKITVDGL